MTIIALISGCETDAQNSGDVTLDTQKDSISYAIGTNISMSLSDIKEEIDLDIIIKAIRDGVDGKESMLTEAEMMGILQEFSNKMMALRQQKKEQEAAENKAEGEAFLEENKKKGLLSTDYNEVNSTTRGTLMSIIVQVEAHGEGSVASFRGKWGVGGMDSLNNEVINSGFGRSKDAFKELALVAGGIKHIKIEYLSD